MTASFTDRTLALAGLFQAALLTQQLARTGQTDCFAFAASVQSLMQLDSASTAAIYGDARGVTRGLELLRDKLGGSTEAGDIEIAKYVISLIHLESQLRRLPDMQEVIHRGIETIQSQMKFFEAEEHAEAVHPRLIEKLAELYSQTISTLTPRIMVNGEHGHLNNAATAAKVRAALFAGIRSAFLWHQLGGSRWHLLFTRKSIITEAAEILKENSERI
jgi:high frequency lysogenization protein